MPHATHKARRIDSSHVSDVPVRRRRTRFEQQALLTVSVGFTMLIIVSLYAASFRAQHPARAIAQDMPRWNLLDRDLLSRAAPVKDELMGVKQTLMRLAGAGMTQADAAAILKAKVEARAAASGTPETPPAETPETPETP
jgi:hypothetical protein